MPDPHARYFGAALEDASLITGPGARLTRTTLQEWLRTSAGQR